jgi:uncharacterized protein (TIGR02145 family)
MKALNQISILLFVFLFSLLLVDCEKVDSKRELLEDPNAELNASALKATPEDIVDEISYLLGLIEEIEALLDNGLLNKGNANALIAKINNAIKSYYKGNAMAATNHLGTLIQKMEAFVAKGAIPEDLGAFLINWARNGILLIEGSFVDPRDGQEYPVVAIGEQIWMAQNLRADKYSDGTTIPKATNEEEWPDLSSDGKAFCWYAFVEDIHHPYGALYNWEAAMNGAGSSDYVPSGVQGVCPTGWHLPSDEEWKVMEMYLGMSREDADIADTDRGTDEAGKLKEAGTAHWLSPNVGATNETGFTALPASQVHPDGRHYTDNRVAFFWTSTKSVHWEGAYDRWFHNYDQQISRDADDLTFGFAVRCIKD